MRKISLFVLSAAALSLSAQNKVDFAGRVVLDAVKNLEVVSRSPLRLVEIPYVISPVEKYTAIVTLDGEADNVELDGAEILSRRDNMVIVRATASKLEAIANRSDVKQLSFGNEAQALMSNARSTTGVDAVQTGSEGLGGSKYTGAGIVTGLMDQGLDVNHINFLDADGVPRTKIVWTFNANGLSATYNTPERIKNFQTEDRSESHGTHVLGIMSGSYNGPAQYVTVSSKGLLQNKKQEGTNSAIPYYGVATDAELAVACGPFSSTNIELGAEKVAEYAKSVGKPCVVNLSIGNTYGPHDGTDARSRWLASVGKDAIVCVSAGNEGDAPVSLNIVSDGQAVKTFASSNTSSTGVVDLWGADSKLFEARFIIYDRSKGTELYSYTVDKNLAGRTVTITGDDYMSTGYIHDKAFNDAFGSRGALFISSNIDPNNNRYNITFNLQGSGNSTTISPAIEIKAPKGQRVDVYANGDFYFNSFGVDGYVDGNPECSINGMACGENILVVGSYTNWLRWPTFAGWAGYSNSPKVGAISSFSSYGTTFDGRRLPDVCAPGGSIISSYSKYYVDQGKVNESHLSGIYTGKTRKSYWGEMQGTSMASPLAAGIIATWLQADPTLTIDDVKAVLKRTATHDQFTEVEPHRWGMGKINALAGLKDILGLSGISDVKADESDFFVSTSDNRNFDIEVIGARGMQAEAYSISGTKVAQVNTDNDKLSLSLDGVQPGVYVLRITASNKTETHKIAVK